MKKLKFASALLFILLTACTKQEIKEPASPPKEKSSFVTAGPDTSYTFIESKYTLPGRNKVLTVTVMNGTKKLYKIYYPASLSGVYPVVTWGNGTGALPKNYDSVLTHLASWGIIAIDNFIQNTGSGEDILAAAEYMIAQNSNSSGIFFNRVDTAHIGAAGHSQGASGVINAYTNFSNGHIIKTIVPIALPSQTGTQSYNTGNVYVPMFFMSGSKDWLISPFSTNKKAYDMLPAGVPAAMGMRKGADHNAIQVTKLHWGYLTAWMQYQLKQDPVAKLAFAGATPELLNNTNWNNAFTRNMDN